MVNRCNAVVKRLSVALMFEYSIPNNTKVGGPLVRRGGMDHK